MRLDGELKDEVVARIGQERPPEPDEGEQRGRPRVAWRKPVKTIMLGALTPLLEKNAIKARTIDSPVVISMSRLIVLAFAVGLLHQVWSAGIEGWPEATLAMAIVLALPMLGALEHSTPDQVLGLARSLVGRFGVGEEPSKYDDHRND